MALLSSLLFFFGIFWERVCVCVRGLQILFFLFYRNIYLFFYGLVFKTKTYLFLEIDN